jgi:hypothetical protein
MFGFEVSATVAEGFKPAEVAERADFGARTGTVHGTPYRVPARAIKG